VGIASFSHAAEDILSYFVCAPDGQFLELCVYRAALNQEHRTPLDEAARDLLARTQWGVAEPGSAAASPSTSTPAPASPACLLWEVWRQDDNGNRYLVSGGHDRSEAERICAEFERRGHEQMYWTVPARNDAGYLTP
jgi:hypothetical protein